MKKLLVVLALTGATFASVSVLSSPANAAGTVGTGCTDTYVNQVLTDPWNPVPVLGHPGPLPDTTGTNNYILWQQQVAVDFVNCAG